MVIVYSIILISIHSDKGVLRGWGANARNMHWLGSPFNRLCGTRPFTETPPYLSE